MNWMTTLAVVSSAIAFSNAAYAAGTKFDPGCEAGSSIKVVGEVNAVELTGVGGPESQTLSIHLSDHNSYFPRSDASAGVFAGYVALFTSAYIGKKTVTIYYGCEVGMRVIHSVELP